MGTYTKLEIADFPVHFTKSEVDPLAMSIFRESDKVIENIPVSHEGWMRSHTSYFGEMHEMTVQYRSTVECVIDRLAIMGFTINASRAWFEFGVKEKIEQYEEWDNNPDCSEWLAPQIEVLRSLTFEKYMHALSIVYNMNLVRWTPREEIPDSADPIVKFIFDDQDWEMHFGFPAYDIRHFFRAFLEVVPKSCWVVQDISDLVNEGYYDIDDRLCEGSSNKLIGDYLIESKVLILTEGSSDKYILEPALRLLYPHLADYFSFMDFGLSKAAGGASALVSTIKSFIGAGIGNRIIALFDNDTAASVALKALNGIEIPRNIMVLKYPDLEICNDYPTNGPSGLTRLNINGLAGSIELYLGRDVLEWDGNLMPIQWRGYESSMGRYQGEIVDKSHVQKRYLEKLKVCQDDAAMIDEYDWDGLRAVFSAIFSCFEECLPIETK